MVTGKSYSKDEGTVMTDSTLYQQAVGSLQYLTITRPGISYSVNKLSQYMENPTNEHFQGVKRIFRHLKGQSRPVFVYLLLVSLTTGSSWSLNYDIVERGLRGI
ncbi:putative copia-type protein [Senna tora]|uniref:Putative copia-type protein n=1 Tax=Senna tora TaxID=362788 RepID=A0A834T029_9FABA|nr:putative copia-type protein [Senna tora]